jgi:hypothetical protein
MGSIMTNETGGAASIKIHAFLRCGVAMAYFRISEPREGKSPIHSVVMPVDIALDHVRQIVREKSVARDDIQVEGKFPAI